MLSLRTAKARGSELGHWKKVTFSPPTLLYLISIEPVLALEPSPIAAFNTFLLLDALTIVDLETSEPLMLIEPVFAVEFLPIAAFKTFLLLEALTIVDFSIFEPSANAELEIKVNKTRVLIVKLFMGRSSWLG